MNSLIEPAHFTRKIHLLSSEVVDQIAAGEVVERPAQLVKELVENALDAGATSVEIEYDQGGRRVRVTDDGAGIASDQLLLALSRHATSKISLSHELWNLSSFGFRGEALASIAAVSRLTLLSRTPGDETAHRVFSEFGKISSVEPSAGNFGTTVLIEELFANVPARLKFMKSEVAESTQIKATLKALALANENVEFRLKCKGRVEAIWPKTDSFLQRARQISGQDKLFESSLTSFEKGEGQLASGAQMTAQIVFAGPHDVTGNARSILIFVQNRWVQDRGLQAAVIDAFRGLLMHGEFPIAFVRLTAPKEDVDVNIHPAKSQIKFRNPQSAFRAVNRALREAIERAPWLVTSPSNQRETTRLSVADLTRPYEVNRALAPKTDLDADPEAVCDPRPEALSLATAPQYSTGRFEAEEFNAVLFKSKEDLKPHVAIESSQASQPSATGAWSRLQVIGQADLTYIVAQSADRLVLVDQHAAHERVVYERLLASWKAGNVSVQPFLLPLSIELEADGAEAIASIAGDLERLGVLVEQNGPRTVAVRAKPGLIGDAALTKVITQLAREVCDCGGSFVLEKKVSDICATMACHSVVRAGQALSLRQMTKLLEQMDEFALSSFCPHGRPVSIEMPFTKIERDFGRIV